MKHSSITRVLTPLLVVMLLSLLAIGCGNAESKAEHAEVIVVGAGIAGLSASLSLAEQGVDVILLEKEDRVGGRLYSVPLGGIDCNLGAQYLYSGGSPLMDSYLETLTFQVIDRLGIVWDGEYLAAGSFEETLAELPISEQALEGFDAAFTQLALDYEEIMQGREFFTDIEPEDPLWEALEGQSCQDYLSSYDPNVYKYLNAELGGENAGEISTLSALLMVGWYGSDSDIPRALVEGGNEVFAESVRDDFLAAGGRLELDSEVVEVKQDSDIVNLTCSDGREFSGDYVIVATPADTAKDIVADLPTSKLDALDAVAYSSVAVIGLHLEGLPDGDEVPGVLFVGDSDVNGYINQTGEITGNPESGTVISAVVSDAALLQLDDAALVRAVVEGLKPINPELDPEKDVLDYAVQRWADGVPKLPPGFLSSFETALREPAGRIFFAGDYGYDPAMGGASWSGMRAASGVLESMGE